MLTNRWRRTAAERLGFDMVGFMNIIRHSLSPFPAAVAQLGRSAFRRFVMNWRLGGHRIGGGDRDGLESAPAATACTLVGKVGRRVGRCEARWLAGRKPNQSLQATPFGAGLEVLSHSLGVPWSFSQY